MSKPKLFCSKCGAEGDISRIKKPSGSYYATRVLLWSVIVGGLILLGFLGKAFIEHAYPGRWFTDTLAAGSAGIGLAAGILIMIAWASYRASKSDDFYGLDG